MTTNKVIKISNFTTDKIKQQKLMELANCAKGITKDYSKIDKESFLRACLVFVNLGINYNDVQKEAYIINYNGEAQIQLGYEYYIRILRESGIVEDFQLEEINADWKFNKDTQKFTYEPENNETIFSDNKKSVQGYYCYIKFTNGKVIIVKKSNADMLNHAKTYSKTHSSGPWSKNFKQMALKTLIRDLARTILKDPSINLQSQSTLKEALAYDQASLTEDLKPNYIDNPQNENNTPTIDKKVVEAQPIENIKEVSYEEDFIDKDDFSDNDLEVSEVINMDDVELC